MINRFRNIYNIFLRSVENSRLLYEAIERAKYMGFDIIYFNPFFKTGQSKSIYSIADYYSFDPFSFDNGMEPEQQIKNIMALCNKNSLIPIIDLVINHTAIDSELIKSNPDFYCYKDGNVKIASGRNANETIYWHDLAQLDYGNIQSGLWDYMLNVCKYYISLGFRGFRCDAADQVSLAFWIWLIREIRKIDSDILFIGEAYLCSTNTRIGLAYAGFDFIYNSAKWWDYKSDWLLNEYNSTCKYISSISFPDNHDTCRLMEEKGGNTRLYLQHLYFTAFWSQGFEITIGTEFGAAKPLSCITDIRTNQEIRKYDFVEYIKEAIKIRSSVLKKYDSATEQRVICRENGVQILKKSCEINIDFCKTEVNICEHSFRCNNVYVFNCIDPQPRICTHFSD